MPQPARLKGVFIAIVVLALSAGVVFAGKALPTAAERGLERAAGAAGFDVPVAAGHLGDEEDPAVEEDEELDEEDEELDEELDEDEDADETAWDNHGAMVSEAAHMETPEGFRNHGHFVSCVAHMDHEALDEAGAPIDLATLTPDGCDGDEEDPVVETTASDGDAGGEKAKAQGNGQGKEKNKDKAKNGRGKGRNNR